MKTHFKVEVWVMWLLAIVPGVVAFMVVLTVPHLRSWHWH
jgi:hypothetical protein